MELKGLLLSFTAILVITFIFTKADALSGDLVSTFGNGGLVKSNFGNIKDGMVDIAVLPDGKIVVSGNSTEGILVTRFNSDGTPDSTFGVQGSVITSITDLGGDLGDTVFASGLVLQPDGKILVAGSIGSCTTTVPFFYGSPQEDCNYDFLLIRYLFDGSVDSTFGDHGKVVVGFGEDETAWAISLLPDGRIVVVGDQYDGSDFDFAIALLNPDGSLDGTFDRDGKKTTGFGERDLAFAVTIREDGKIVVAGDSGNNFALAVYNNDGSYDTTFDQDGLRTVKFDQKSAASAKAVAIINGKIVVAGMATTADGNSDFALACLNFDGSLDTTFGQDGRASTDFEGHFDNAKAIQTLPDGTFVLAGYSGTDFALAKYRTHPSDPGVAGTLDPLFGNQGKVITDFEGGTDSAFAASIDPTTGTILVAGRTKKDGVGNIALARYQNSYAWTFAFAPIQYGTIVFNLQQPASPSAPISTPEGTLPATPSPTAPIPTTPEAPSPTTAEERSKTTPITPASEEDTSMGCSLKRDL